LTCRSLTTSWLTGVAGSWPCVVPLQLKVQTNNTKKRKITKGNIQKPLSVNCYIPTMSGEVRMNNINSFKLSPNKMSVSRSS